MELNWEPYPSEVDEAVDMELATVAKKRNLKNKTELPRGEGMGQSNFFIQSCIVGFQRFIEKWEPKFEEWDQTIKGVEGRDVGQPPLQYGRLEGKNVPAKLSDTCKPTGDSVECSNALLRNSHSKESKEDSNSNDSGGSDGESKECDVNGVALDHEVVELVETIGMVKATIKSAAAAYAGNTTMLKGKIPTKDQNQGSSSNINVSKRAGNAKA